MSVRKAVGSRWTERSWHARASCCRAALRRSPKYAGSLATWAESKMSGLAKLSPVIPGPSLWTQPRARGSLRRTPQHSSSPVVRLIHGLRVALTQQSYLAGTLDGVCSSLEVLWRFRSLTQACRASRGPPLANSRASRKPCSRHSRCYPLQPGPATPPQLVLSVSDLFLVFG